MDAQTTAALIGAAAVTGTIAGTLIGAHIQAAAWARPGRSRPGRCRHGRVRHEPAGDH